jgi:hypothetical protein
MQNQQGDCGPDDQIRESTPGCEDQSPSKDGLEIGKRIRSRENPGSPDVNFSATLLPKKPQTADVCC